MPQDKENKKKKFAIKKLFRDKNGVLRYRLVDIETGKVVTNPENYVIYDQFSIDLATLGLARIEDDKKEKDEKDEKDKGSEKQTTRDISQRDGEAYGKPGSYGPFGSKEILSNILSSSKERNSENNYGFLEKTLLGTIGQIIPGITGIIGNIVEAGRRASNIHAINAARADLGLPPMTREEAKEAFEKYGSGFVGYVTVDGVTYRVGIDPKNLGTVSAQRVKEHAKEFGFEIRKATPEEISKVEESGSSFTITTPLSEKPKEAAESVVKESEEKLSFKDAFSDLGDLAGTMEALQAQRDNISRSVQGGLISAISGVNVSGQASKNFGDIRAETKKGLENIDIETAFDRKYGKLTTDDPQQQVIDSVRAAVGGFFGPGHTAVGLSGTRPGSTKPGHSPFGITGKGRALDFFVSDPKGNIVTDKSKIDGFLGYLAKQNPTSSIGHDKNYMGMGRIHFALDGRSQQWGAKNTQHGYFSPGVPNMDPATKQAILEGRRLGLEAHTVPTPRPDELGGKRSGALGLFEKNLDKVVQTISGELGSRTINNILNGTEEQRQQARLEIANMAAVMGNRFQDPKIKNSEDPVKSLFDPNKFQALLPQNLDQTNRNFGLIGDFVRNSVKDYVDGKITPPMPNATHYHAIGVKPSWKDSILESKQVGEHNFAVAAIKGTNTPEFSPQKQEEFSTEGLGKGGIAKAFESPYQQYFGEEPTQEASSGFDGSLDPNDKTFGFIGSKSISPAQFALSEEEEATSTMDWKDRPETKNLFDWSGLKNLGMNPDYSSPQITGYVEPLKPFDPNEVSPIPSLLENPLGYQNRIDRAFFEAPHPFQFRDDLKSDPKFIRDFFDTEDKIRERLQDYQKSGYFKDRIDEAFSVPSKMLVLENMKELGDFVQKQEQIRNWLDERRINPVDVLGGRSLVGNFLNSGDYRDKGYIGSLGTNRGGENIGASSLGFIGSRGIDRGGNSTEYFNNSDLSDGGDRNIGDVGSRGVDRGGDRENKSIDKSGDRENKSIDKSGDRENKSIDKSGDRENKSIDKSGDRENKSIDRSTDQNNGGWDIGDWGGWI